MSVCGIQAMPCAGGRSQWLFVMCGDNRNSQRAGIFHLLWAGREGATGTGVSVMPQFCLWWKGAGGFNIWGRFLVL